MTREPLEVEEAPDAGIEVRLEDEYITGEEDSDDYYSVAESFQSNSWYEIDDDEEDETESTAVIAHAGAPPSPQPRKVNKSHSCYDYLVRFHRRLRTYWRNHQVCCVWLLIYASINILAFYYKANVYVTSQEEHHIAARAVFGSCVVVARGAAMCLNLNAFLILLPLCRHLWTFVQRSPAIRCYSCVPSKKSPYNVSNSSKTKRLHWSSWLPLDQWVFIHKVIGAVFLYWTLVHCAAHGCDFYRFTNHPYEEDLLLLFPNEESMPADPASRWAFLLQQPAAITGIIMLVCILVAYPCIIFHRKLGYNAFWYSHHLLLVMLVALMFHGIGRLLEPPQSIYWVGVPLFLYMIPRLWREVASLVCSKARVQVLQMAVKPGNVVVLKLTKPPSWKRSLQAGMYANLNIPSLSALQWHPFTISSAPSEDFVEFHIRPVGDWTRELYKLAKAFPRQIPSVSTKNDLEQAALSGTPSKETNVSPPSSLHATTTAGHTSPSHRRRPEPSVQSETTTTTVASSHAGRSRRGSSSRWLWDTGASMLNLDSASMLNLGSRELGSTEVDESDPTITISTSTLGGGGGALDTFKEEDTATEPRLNDLVVKLDGPLGAPSVGYSQHRMVVLVGAGIGITPMISVLKELLANPGKMQRTYFIWAFRERKAMNWFASVINDVMTKSLVSPRRRRQVLEVKLFVTSVPAEDVNDSFNNDMSLALNVQYGHRPNWPEELTRIHQEIRASYNYNKCGIFICGPKSMTKVIRKTSFRISQQDPDFHFYCRQETFSF